MSEPRESPQILECSLRDGSYAVDFSFSMRFTEDVVRVLAALGFPRIEVGHGVGIGANDRGLPAAATDSEYALAAHIGAQGAPWGMFAIPGVADTSAVENILGLGASFIRVGLDPDHFLDGLRFIEEVSWGDSEIFVNFMKSHALSPDELGVRTQQLEDLGVSGAYLVDSSGGMLPHEIRARAQEMRRSSSLLLGFHGHDNLGLATAHSLSVAECGFDIIDTTLQGIGRSAGNTSSERFIGLMTRLGWNHSYDLISVLLAGQKFMRPMLPSAGYSGLDTLSGVFFFHTSFLPQLVQVASEHGLDPHVLMQGHYEMRQEDPGLTLESAARVIGSTGGDANLLGEDGPYFGVPETDTP